MNTRIRTACVSLAVVALLTLLKFILYYVSGSYSVLSEALHSFSDICTSFLVLIAIYFEHRSKKNVVDGNEQRWKKPEIIISFSIALFLLTVFFSLVFKLFSAEPVNVSRPLITGIIFIVLSQGSYFLHYFQRAVGLHENSAALMSDSMHSKGDMVCSLVAGSSLILYHFGWNVDLFASMLIALFIFLFAVQIFFNVFIYVRKESDSFSLDHSIFEIFQYFFNKKQFTIVIDFMEKKLKWQILKKKNRDIMKSGMKITVFLAILSGVFYLSSQMVFTVNMGEEAIVERLGKPLSTSALQPGLHFRFPAPFDRVIQLNTKEIRSIYLGNISGENNLPLIWQEGHGDEIHFLSGDDNFFTPYIIVHYQISDLYSYSYHHAQPDELLENLAYTILLEEFNTKTFYEIAVKGRKMLEKDISQKLQRGVELYNCGVSITNVICKDIHPPRSNGTAYSFETVIASFQKKETMINFANRYRNQRLPQAQGSAYAKVSSAHSYVTEEVLNAKGKAVRFNAKLDALKKNRQITEKLFFFQSVANVYNGRKKILIDPKVGTPSMIMNTQGSLDLSEMELK